MEPTDEVNTAQAVPIKILTRTDKLSESSTDEVSSTRSIPEQGEALPQMNAMENESHDSNLALVQCSPDSRDENVTFSDATDHHTASTEVNTEILVENTLSLVTEEIHDPVEISKNIEEEIRIANEKKAEDDKVSYIVDLVKFMIKMNLCSFYDFFFQISLHDLIIFITILNFAILGTLGLQFCAISHIIFFS